MATNTYKHFFNLSFFENIDRNNFKDIDFKPFYKYIDYSGDSQEYIIGRYTATEHYNLLAYISTCIDNITILDIGTFRALSAIALSYNKANKVYSFDTGAHMEYSRLFSDLTNIKFTIDNVINGKYDELIQDSSLILLDTNHLGDFELEFHNYLIKIGYKGTVLYDDIQLNDEMKEFWSNITHTKLDISHIGHITGTGVVFYE